MATALAALFLHRLALWVAAPGPLVAGPGPLAASPDPVFNDANQINTVAVKLPELWQSKVCSWFAQAEAQFATSGISTSLGFHE